MKLPRQMNMNIYPGFNACQRLKMALLLSLLFLMSACGTTDNSTQQNDLADGMASLSVTIPGLNANRQALKNNSVAQRAGVPDEVTSILIQVLNDNDVLLDSAEIIGTDGTVELTIAAGENYTLRGSAFAATELLFFGEVPLQTLTAGTRSTVNLTLADQIQLLLTSPGDIEVGIGITSIDFNLSGLNNIAINWYVNNVAGGTAEFGFIDNSGRYTPPGTVPSNPVISITAEPVVSPSFAESFSFTLLPSDNVNNSPIANAGTDQTVLEQSVVSLNGSGSNDTDGSIATFNWLQTSGIAVTLSSATLASPDFTAPAVTTESLLVFELSVVDNEGASDVDSVSITVTPLPNIPPVANAGADQTVNVGDNVILSGVASNDPDGTIVSYQWTLNSEDLFPVLINGNTATASFIAPQTQYGGSAHYSLTVTDNDGATDFDEVVIIVNGNDQPLLADAGIDQIVDEATLVTLDGSASNDPDNTITTYLWEELSSGGILLSDSSAQMPTFTAPDVTTATDYQFRITVTNNHGEQAIDEVTITVNNVTITTSKNYFSATADGFNYNIWVTDGTNVGTFEVATVATSNIDFAQYKTVNNFFYFQGNDGTNGRELWRTDGTAAGTQMFPVAADSAYIGFGASYSADPTSFAVLGDRLLFGAATSFDTFRFAEYLSLDTTTDVMTSVFADGQPVVSNPDSKHIGVYNGFVYFHYTSFSPVFSSALYRTDGINSAVQVKSGFTSTFSHDFTEYNGELYFVSGNNELWKTDGTDAGTTLVKTFSGFVGYVSDGVSHRAANQVYFIVHNGSLLFVADDGEGRELWISDGSSTGTVLLKDLDNSIASTNPTEFSLINGQLIFFSSEGDGTTDGIWTSDGTEAGTTRLLSLNVAADVTVYTGKETAIPTVIDSLNLLFFVADDGTGSELWKTDGTLAGTSMVKNIHTAFSSTPAIFKAGDGVLIFSAKDDDERAKLWRSDGTDAGTTIIQDVLPSGFDNNAFFPAFD